MTKYTRETLEHLQATGGALDEAADLLDHDNINMAIAHIHDHVLTARDDFNQEATEYHFILCLQEQAEKDGYGLVDDGTMDTVLRCPTCNGWLRFDGREGAIMFMENGDECWLCGTDEDDKGA